MLFRSFSGEQHPFIRNIFTLKKCSSIVGSQVLCFEDEGELLEAWAAFMQQVDPDLIIGYNISNFDFPYLIDRANALHADKFPHLGRMKGWSKRDPFEFSNLLFFSQAGRQKSRTPIFHLEHMVKEIQKRLFFMEDCSWTFSSICNVNSNYEVTH